MRLTIFTPTYNRAHCLERLFSSLSKQTDTEFEWLIVDDGSTDGTADVVKTFVSKSCFNVRYYYKENTGKAQTINYGSGLAVGDYFFIVDSDDELMPDAVARIKKWVDAIEAECDGSFCGVVGLRSNRQGGVIRNERGGVYDNKSQLFSEPYIDATVVDYRYKLRYKGDRAEVVRTDLLKKFPFPRFNNEKFISEDVLWLTLSIQHYKFRWYNEVVYLCEYRSDGMTKHISELNRKNCFGKCYYENMKLGICEIPIKKRYKYAIHYMQYGLISGMSISEIIKKSKAKWLSLLTLPIALIYAVCKNSK